MTRVRQATANSSVEVRSAQIKVKRQSDTAVAPSRLDNIQILRAIAATMIVLLHTQLLVDGTAKRANLHESAFSALPLGAGVDLFFVISGFIIVYASEKLFGTGNVFEFLRRRVLRIVPLYWMALLARLAVLSAGTALGVKAFPDIKMILTSFFFIPYDAQGFGAAYPFPILDLGWSLNFEMFFYVLFSAVILFRRKAAVVAVVGLLFVAAVAGTISPPTVTSLRFWTHPLTLEFAAGACIALAYREGVQIGPYLSLGLGFAAILWWGLLPISTFETSSAPGSYSWPRVFTWGMGAVMLVAAAALWRGTIRIPFFASAARLGDSSYSQYLLHPFVLLAAGQVLRRAPPTQVLLWPVILIIVAVIVGAARYIHIWVERPVVRALQVLTDPRRPPRPLMIDAN